MGRRAMSRVAIATVAGLALFGASFAAAGVARPARGTYSAGRYETPPQAGGPVVSLRFTVRGGRVAAGALVVLSERRCGSGGRGRLSVPVSGLFRAAGIDGSGRFVLVSAAGQPRVRIEVHGRVRGTTATLLVVVPAFLPGQGIRCPRTVESLAATIEAAHGSLLSGDGPVNLTVQPTSAHVGQPVWLATTSVSPAAVRAAHPKILRVWEAHAGGVRNSAGGHAPRVILRPRANPCGLPKASIRTHDLAHGTVSFLDRFTFPAPGLYVLCADVLGRSGHVVSLPGALPQPWYVGPILICRPRTALLYSARTGRNACS